MYGIFQVYFAYIIFQHMTIYTPTLFQFSFFLMLRRNSYLMACYCSVAKYQEANPGVFTVVTFPFLFAVMFGDWGHGICLLLATLVLIIREKKLSSQVILS